MGCTTSSPSKVAQPLDKEPRLEPPPKTLLEGPENGTNARDIKSLVAEASPSVSLNTGHGQGFRSEAPRIAAESQSRRVEVGAHSCGSGHLKKQRAVGTKAHELDLMVVEFTSHDSTVGSAIGRNCKEMKWKVMCNLHSAPIDIKMNAQEHKLHCNEVSVESNGLYLLHGAGSHTKVKMLEDFHFQWPFRGTIRGINEIGFFEFHPPHVPAWLPVIITEQRADGYFEVRTKETDARGRVMEMTYPAVRKDDLREATSQKPIAIPENCLRLHVPKQDPSHATLCLANGELVTHHFGRPSPAPGSQKPEIALKVSKDRTQVTANVGHRVLSHFVSGEAQATHSEGERLRHSWTVQLGPFAEHTIEVMKKTFGKIITLLVDGKVLVEASASDIGCEGNEWRCEFRFVGERALDFEVYKTNTDGAPLDETDHVKEIRKYIHECVVVIPNDWDFHSARLCVDGAPFQELPVTPLQHEEASLSVDPMVMLHSYGISTPYKVDPAAPSNIMVFASRVVGKAEEGRKAARGLLAGGLLARCYDCSAIVDHEGQM